MELTLIRAKTMTALMSKAVKQLFTFRVKNHQYCGNALRVENVCLVADEALYSFDLYRHLWLTRTRWTRLLNQYIDPIELQLFLKSAESILRKDVKPGTITSMGAKHVTRSEKNHKWGGCFMGMAFHGSIEDQPTITMYSRTCFIGYIGMLDAAIAWNVCRELMERVDGVTMSDFKFVWHITMGQVHSFKILPWVTSHDDLRKEMHRRAKLKHDPTVWHFITRWHNTLKRELEEHGPLGMIKACKYGPWRRIQTRWLEANGYLEPVAKPTPISSCTLKRLLGE